MSDLEHLAAECEQLRKEIAREREARVKAEKEREEQRAYHADDHSMRIGLEVACDHLSDMLHRAENERSDAEIEQAKAERERDKLAADILWLTAQGSDELPREDGRELTAAEVLEYLRAKRRTAEDALAKAEKERDDTLEDIKALREVIAPLLRLAKGYRVDCPSVRLNTPGPPEIQKAEALLAATAEERP